ncbi:L-fucose:H+ symporter permease [Novosphingobium terrae]|uniref:L-fucose:H+ symporter permease n=1 Tax=Novosphingobium terrae TaxID=2726189 RepID=UPI00197FB340|nr:L-fucose:H+ symporter permease [Novosphingobium terrae]
MDSALSSPGPQRGPQGGIPVSGRFITRGYALGFAVVTSLFLIWAIANNFNDILIRQLQKALALNRAQAGFIQFAFYLGYFFMALPAGLVARRFGYRMGILVGLLLYACGALLFYPASYTGLYAPFLIALFVLASGAAFLETSANPCIAGFGDPSRASQRLNFAQAFNGLGAVIAPILGGTFIFSGVERSAADLAAMSAAKLSAYRAFEAAMVRMPYLVLAGVVLLVALAVALVRLPRLSAAEDQQGEAPGLRWVLRQPGLRPAVVAQFFYVGAQVCVWSFFVDYVKEMQPEVSERHAAYLLSFSLFLFMVGRFSGAALMQKIDATRLLLIYAVAGALLCLAAMMASGVLAVGALALTSFFMSIMFPTIFALGIARLGSFASLGAPLIVMAIVGGAVFPPAMGWLAQLSGSLRWAMLVPTGCFAVVLIFALGQRRMD